MEIAFIVYALAFRLSGMLVGALCLILGFRLFVLGVMPREGSDIDAETGNVRLSVKNAAPGSVFAAFGAVIVCTMILAGLPALERPAAEGGATLSLRGDRPALSDPETDRAEIAQLAGVLSNNEMPLGEAAPSLRELAQVYLRQGRLDEAFAYVSLAITINRSDAAALMLLSEIETARGNPERAGAALRAALALDPTMLEPVQ
jgi:tetratricopeptide (TPR) repeat protein